MRKQIVIKLSPEPDFVTVWLNLVKANMRVKYLIMEDVEHQVKKIKLCKKIKI